MCLFLRAKTETYVQDAERIVKQHKKRSKFWKAFMVAAVTVVFATTYMLILPAITMESDTVCGKEEHVHTQDCYETITELTCGLEECDGHVHTEECYDEEGNLVCTLEESTGHQHTEACYTSEEKLKCDTEEHTHTDKCYEKKAVDVESKSDWEATLPSKLTGVKEKDLVLVAQSQIGYSESTENVITDDSGTKKGYTRYGDWYGNEYDDWDAMFVAFCLHYANIPTSQVPINAGCRAWVVDLKGADLYKAASKYEPAAGDIVFFDTQDKGYATHVGIIEKAEDDSITVIEGDRNDKVMRKSYSKNASSIYGYGQISEETSKADEKEDAKESAEKVKYTYEDDDIAVTAKLEKADAIPDEAKLVVKAVTENTAGYNYDAYMKALNESAKDVTYEAGNTLLYDVAFLIDGVEYQPEAGSVSLKFEFKKDQLKQIAGNQNVAILHLPLADEIREKVDTTAEATDITAEDISVEVVSQNMAATDSAKFKLDNFSLVMFGANGQTYNVTNPGTYRNFQDVLGNAVNFGVTANTIKKDAHMDTNFACVTLDSPGGGNVTAGAYAGVGERVGGMYYVAQTTSGSTLKVDGNNFRIRTTQTVSNNRGIYAEGQGASTVIDTKENIQRDVEDMISYVKTVSTAMYNEPTATFGEYGDYWDMATSSMKTGWHIDQNNATLDLTGLPNGTYYIKGDDLANCNGLKIKKRSTQIVVFNYSGKKVYVKRYECWNTDKETGYIQTATSDQKIFTTASTVIFNMPYATSLNFQEATAGTFLAPNASIDGYGGTSSGWVVCKYFTNPGGEWHCVYAGMPNPNTTKPTISAQLNATKNVDGQAPTDDQQFQFLLESWNGSRWTTVEYAKNKNGVISFSKKEYNDKATEYYRVTEVNQSGGAEYEYDTTRYVVKRDVTAPTSSTLAVTQTIYKSDSIYNLNNKVDSIVFDNTTKKQEFELPHTGGTGTVMFTVFGVLMVTGSSIFFVSNYRRKENM